MPCDTPTGKVNICGNKRMDLDGEMKAEVISTVKETKSHS